MTMISQPKLTNREAVTIKAPPVTLPPYPPRFFHPGELAVLVELVRGARTMIEFGCNEGRAAAALLLNLPTMEEYLGVDVLPGYVTIKECQRKEVPEEPGKFAAHDPRFRLLLRARGTLDLQGEDLPPADAVFIDADHSRLGVTNDYMLARDIIRPGGIIVFHDDNGLPVVEVSETLDEFAAAGRRILHVRDTWLAFERF